MSCKNVLHEFFLKWHSKKEMQEIQIGSLGQEDSLEMEMAIHSSILAWEIPWTEEPSRLQSTGLQRVGHDWATSLHFKGAKELPSCKESAYQCRRCGFNPLDRKDPLEEEMATDSSILAWRIPWTEEPGGLQSMGSQKVGHSWATNTIYTLLIKETILNFYRLGWLTWQITTMKKFTP